MTPAAAGAPEVEGLGTAAIVPVRPGAMCCGLATVRPMSPTEAVTFVTGSDPFDGDWGDKVITRLLIQAAAETGTVRVVALSEAPASTARGAVDVSIVPKPPLRLPLAAARALARRRSVIHDYFRVPELTEALRGRDDPLLVAEHTYMAES